MTSPRERPSSPPGDPIIASESAGSGPAPEQPDSPDGGSTASEHTRAGAAWRLVGSTLESIFPALVLLSALIGAGLAPALPGTRSGIAPLIEATWVIAAWLSQATMLVVCLLGAMLLIKTMAARRIHAALRLVMVPFATGVLSVLYRTIDHQISEAWATRTIGLTVATLALAAGLLALRNPLSRAAGFVLTCCGASALLHLGGRVIALHASSQALVGLFTFGRGLSTAALVVDIVALGLAGAWLSAPRPRRGAVVGAALVALAAAGAYLASGGTQPDSSYAEIIASRMCAALISDPVPFTGLAVRYAVEVLALLVAASCLFARRRVAALTGSIGIALVVRGSVDTPLFAGGLLVAAFLLLLASVGGRDRSLGGVFVPPMASTDPDESDG